jgi:hypothetical protein
MIIGSTSFKLVKMGELYLAKSDFGIQRTITNSSFDEVLSE